MASHGRSGLQRVFAGSVAEQVVAGSPVPVLVVKPGGQRIQTVKRVLVPIAGTTGGALALGIETPLARSTNSGTALVQVVPPLPMWLHSGT